MKVEHTTELSAPPEAIIEYMLSPAYAEALVEAIDAVEAIEEISRQAHESGQVLERVMRYTAPTAGKIPKFLKKYEDRAPDKVHWEQRERWERERGRMSYEIEADIKPDWQRYYDTRGELELTPQGQSTKLEATLSYDVNVFGLGRVIERALRSEVERILETQAEVTRRHLGAR